MLTGKSVQNKYVTDNKSISSKKLDYIEFNSNEVFIQDKVYMINKCNLKADDTFPSGISTAFLNAKENFQSAGYLGKSMGDNCFYFISVEEKMDFIILTNNLEVFVYHEDQIIYFILTLLNIFNIMQFYDIKLNSSVLMFSCRKSEDKWRFRIDNIGDFYVIGYKEACINYEFLIVIILRFLKIVKSKPIKYFLKDLLKLARNLNSIDMLIEKAEHEIIYSKSMIEQSKTGKKKKTCCWFRKK